MTEYPIWIGESIFAALRSMATQLDADDAPLTRADAATLDYIKAHPGQETAEIARSFGIKRSAMHARLGRLVRRNLVQPTYASSTGGKIAQWWVK